MKKLAIFLAIFVIIFVVFELYNFTNSSDAYCNNKHTTTSKPISTPKSGSDFFSLGNYHYDIGNCKQAIANYSRAIELNPNYAEAYNNRAYTNMRLHNYKEALTDLNKAIAIKPNYVTALMNRGDIYNYFYNINHQKAIADYNTVIALGKEKDRSGSVCGHKSMAETNNLIPLAALRVLTHVDCK